MRDAKEGGFGGSGGGGGGGGGNGVGSSSRGGIAAGVTIECSCWHVMCVCACARGCLAVAATTPRRWRLTVGGDMGLACDPVLDCFRDSGRAARHRAYRLHFRR